MAEEPARRRPTLRQLHIETIYRFECPYCGYVKKDPINEIVRRTAEKHLAKEERNRQWREAQDAIARGKMRGTYTQLQPHPIRPLNAVGMGSRKAPRRRRLRRIVKTKRSNRKTKKKMRRV